MRRAAQAIAPRTSRLGSGDRQDSRNARPRRRGDRRGLRQSGIAALLARQPATSGTASIIPQDGASTVPDRCDEAIAPARQRLDEPRVLGRVAEHLAQLLDRRVEGVIEIDEGVGAGRRAARAPPRG